MKTTLSDVMGTLDELGAATRDHDRLRYRAALNVARAQRLTDEQIKDAHVWSNAGAPFDWLGQPSPSRGRGAR